MSMEFKVNSTGGGDSRPLFRDGRAELSGSFGACRGVGGSGEDEFCEEIELAWGLDSASMFVGCLAEEALV